MDCMEYIVKVFAPTFQLVMVLFITYAVWSLLCSLRSLVDAATAFLKARTPNDDIS